MAVPTPTDTDYEAAVHRSVGEHDLALDGSVNTSTPIEAHPILRSCPCCGAWPVTDFGAHRCVPPWHRARRLVVYRFDRHGELVATEVVTR